MATTIKTNVFLTSSGRAQVVNKVAVAKSDFAVFKNFTRYNKATQAALIEGIAHKIDRGELGLTINPEGKYVTWVHIGNGKYIIVRPEFGPTPWPVPKPPRPWPWPPRSFPPFPWPPFPPEPNPCPTPPPIPPLPEGFKNKLKEMIIGVLAGQTLAFKRTFTNPSCCDINVIKDGKNTLKLLVIDTLGDSVG